MRFHIIIYNRIYNQRYIKVVHIWDICFPGHTDLGKRTNINLLTCFALSSFTISTHDLPSSVFLARKYQSSRTLCRHRLLDAKNVHTICSAYLLQFSLKKKKFYCHHVIATSDDCHVRIHFSFSGRTLKNNLYRFEDKTFSCVTHFVFLFLFIFIAKITNTETIRERKHWKKRCISRTVHVQYLLLKEKSREDYLYLYIFFSLYTYHKHKAIGIYVL